MPMYGLCLWNHKDTTSRSIFKTYRVAYSNVLKRMVGVPTYASSHITADICESFLFEHYLALLKVRYFKRMLKSDNCLIKLNIPFLERGFFMRDVSSLFDAE